MAEPEDSRRLVSPEELAVLQPVLLLYHNLPKRSKKRQELIAATLATLPDPDLWTSRTIRTWLYNHEPRAPPPVPNVAEWVDGRGIAGMLGEIQKLVRLSLEEIRAMKATQQAHPSTVLSPQETLNEFVVLFATKNLPLYYLNDWVFRDFVHHLNPLIQIPNDAELRRGILRRAVEIRSQVTCESEGSPFCALMADGVTRAGRIWIAAVLATAKRFHFWRLAPVQNQRAGTIADVIADIVRKLAADHHLSVVSVVTDNASNEKSALDRFQAHSVQAKTGVLLFRTPCISHTVNLAIQDCLKQCFPDRAVLEDMRAIRDALPHRSRNDVFFRVPVICETRWLSFGDFVKWMDAMYPAVHDALSTKERPLNILKSYHFKALSQCCEILNRLIRWSEFEEARISRVWSKISLALSEFDGLIPNGNVYAASFKAVFFARIIQTADVKPLLLAYILTHEGLLWYRTRSDVQTDIRSAVEEPLSQFQFRLGIDPITLHLILNHYLAEETFPDSVKTTDFWKEKRELMVPINMEIGGEPQQVPYLPLCEIALRLCGLPCSEASVERAFSQLRFIFGDYRQSLGAELVEAMLVIRLNRECPSEVRTLGHSLQGILEGKETTQETALESFAAALQEENQGERGRHWAEEHLSQVNEARNPRKG
jgi:hypothetical protein